MQILIKSRFCGPRTSGNGGYSAGLIGKHLGAAAQVTLRQPPPLDAPIELRSTDGGLEATHAGELIATARPATVTIDRPPLPEASEVRAARAHYEARAGEHLLPHCFVCGVSRAEGDGLRIFAGPVESSTNGGVHAADWVPAPDLAGEDGLVEPEFLWAALDCPGYFALPLQGELCLLGQLTVEIHRRPKAGEKLLCLAWPSGQQGRKYFADSALVDENDETVAGANAVWIRLDDPALVERMRRENALEER